MKLLWVVVLLLLAPAARAGELGLRPELDAPLLAAGGQMMLMSLAVQDDAAPPDCGTTSTPACDPRGLSALDRTAIGGDCETCGRVSDAFLFGAPALAVALSGIDGLELGWETFAEDFVILGEVVLLSGGAQQLASLALRRPRPYLYTPGLREPELRESVSATRSFFSGHTSTVVGVATAFAYLYTARRPELEHPELVWLGAFAFATPVAALRVKAGSHFWSDVLVGAAVGVGSGLAIPWLHRHRLSGVRFTAGPSSIGVLGDF